MKQYLLIAFGSACLAIGLSAHFNSKYTGIYYFKNVAGGSRFAGTASFYIPTDVIRILSPWDAQCGADGELDCVVTFNTNALTQTNFSKLAGPAMQRGTVDVKSF